MKYVLACILLGTTMLSQRSDDKTLRNRVAEEGRDILITHSPGMPLVASNPGVDPVRKLVCRAEVILIGKVLRQQSELTADEKNVQTLIEVRLQRLVKPIPDKRDLTGEFLVIRPGGTVKIGEHSVFESYGSFEPLIDGQTYLFLLKRMPGTSHYESIDSFGTFHQKNDRFRKTTAEPGEHELEGPAGLSTKKIEKVLLSCPERQ
jgi:hypothetical protein